MGRVVEKEWFYLTLGHRRGPVTHEEFCKKIAKKEIYIESTQVWKQGMKQWVNLTDAKPFDVAIRKVNSVAVHTDARVRDVAGLNDNGQDIVYLGASRALFNMYFYFGWLIPVLLGIVIVTELQVQQLVTPTRVRSSLFFQSVPLILLVLTTWQMAAKRMQHAGYSKARGLGVFVPIYNLWVLFACLLLPSGYGAFKKLGAGVIFYILLFGIIITGSVLLLAPKMRVNHFSPLAMTESLSNYYKEKTGFSSRYKANASQASSSKARQE